MNTKSIIYNLYETFTTGIINESFDWKSTDKTDVAVDRFIGLWEDRGISEDSLGITFLYDYFCYAYNYWTKDGSEKIVINLDWIIGKGQIKRWDGKHEDYRYFYREGLLKNNKITPLSEIKSLLKKKGTVEIDVSEEYDRQRFYNTSDGLIRCILATSLCDPKSKWCDKCLNREGCIEELKIRDKRTALKRGFIKL